MINIEVEEKITPENAPISLAWTNYDNSDFYETLRAEGLEKLAKEGGLAAGCDIVHLEPYWMQASSLLEVGAGYGRVIKTLLNHNFAGKITAIERCKASYQHLYKQYGDHIELYNYDAHHLHRLEGQFDLILWLWSGIADFSPSEQVHVLSQLKERLATGGYLIIDTMPENVAPVRADKTQNYGKQVYISRIDGATVHTYEPNAQEIESYAAAIGLKQVERQVYQTATGRDRWLHILS